MFSGGKCDNPATPRWPGSSLTGRAWTAGIVAPDSRGRAGVIRPESDLRDERFRPPAPSPVVAGPTEDNEQLIMSAEDDDLTETTDEGAGTAVAEEGPYKMSLTVDIAWLSTLAPYFFNAAECVLVASGPRYATINGFSSAIAADIISR